MIEHYLDKNELSDLAEYLKRITFDDAYRRAEGDGEYRKAKAYRYIDAITKLQNLLADMGYSPR